MIRLILGTFVVMDHDGFSSDSDAIQDVALMAQAAALSLRGFLLLEYYLFTFNGYPFGSLSSQFYYFTF
jgi:hypothetical protein